VWPDVGRSGPVGVDGGGDEGEFGVVEEVHFVAQLDDWLYHVDGVCGVVED